MKIVFLDSIVINNGDISWEPLERLGELVVYKRTLPEMLAAHIGDATAVFSDAVPIGREVMKQCPKLQFIGVAATGYNHIDLKAAQELGIAVCNVPNYSTEAVAQHAFALLLAVSNRVDLYNRAVAEGVWSRCTDYTFVKTHPILLAGKSLGIIGYGNIGKKVAEFAKAFGMTVYVYSKEKEKAVGADVVSLHCPLTEETAGMVNQRFIDEMKDGAVLINTARGGLIDEDALARALKAGKLAGAGLDVLREEPPRKHTPLIGLENCYITPHIGFIALEARKTAIDTCVSNLKSFLKGEKENRVV